MYKFTLTNHANDLAMTNCFMLKIISGLRFFSRNCTLMPKPVYKVKEEPSL